MGGERVVGVFGLLTGPLDDEASTPPAHPTPRQAEVLRQRRSAALKSITRAGSASCLPFKVRLAAAASGTRVERRPNKRSERTICPAAADDCRRAAVLTTRPTQ